MSAHIHWPNIPHFCTCMRFDGVSKVMCRDVYRYSALGLYLSAHLLALKGCSPGTGQLSFKI
jgi:hypothetical protein